MPNIQQQLTELRQQNNQLLEELRTLTGEFRAFRAEVMQEQDPYQFAYFYPGISHEQKEQVVLRLQQAVRGGSRKNANFAHFFRFCEPQLSKPKSSNVKIYHFSTIICH